MSAASEASFDASPWLSRDFIFVGGMHRSGTTLLARIIASSGVSTGLESSGAHMGEGQFLQDVYPIGKEYGGTNLWALDPRSHLTESDALAIPDGARRLWDSWSEHWDLDKQFLVEKTPLNIAKTRFLQEFFPRSTFVVITRHPVTQSLAVRKWSGTRLRRWGLHFSQVIENWVAAHEAFFSDQGYLERVHVVRYEDLIVNPQAEIARLEGALGLSFPGAADEFDGSRASTYEDEWVRLTGRGVRDVGKARGAKERARAVVEHALMSREAQKARATYGSRVRALGYDLDDLRRVDPWPDSAPLSRG